MPLRLLIAEDSEDDALLLVRTLRQADFAVAFERVDTPAALSNALSSASWDVVLSDYNMPAFNGVDALRIVRAQSRDIPFIFVSGSIGEEIAVSAMRAGAQDYVMKGNLQRLAPAISREMHEAEMRRRRISAEVRLRSTTDIMQAMFSASPLAIIITDVHGMVQFWNPAAQHLFGWTEAEVMGLRNPTLPEDSHQVPLELRGPSADAEQIVGRDVKRLRRDGTLIDVNVAVAPIGREPEGVRRIMVLVQDIRDRKRLEAQILQAQKMDAIGQLAGGIAHDFNNLLTVISSYSDFLLEDLTPGDAHRDDIAEIRSAAEAATGLSRQLLIFSRNQVLQPQVVPINEVLSGTAKMLGRLLGANVELVLSLDEHAGLLEVDPGQLEQVVMNLAINARDAMPSGGKLVVETRNTLDERAGESAVPHVTLTVSDNGSGMDAATQARIFEPFFTTKEVGKGTGLGLSTVYTIVQQAAGFIRVYSEVNHGTTFAIHLPRIDVPSASPPSPTGSALETLRGSEVVLIVEDAAAVRSVARQVLERFGYTVLEAPDGQIAVNLAAKLHGKIDLLVTDIVMPGMSGRDVADQILAMRPNTKVLFTSGYTANATHHHGVLDEGVQYLQKPFTPETLAGKVRETLDRPASK